MNTKFSELISFFKKKELEEILKMGEKKINGMFTDSITVLKTICKKHAAIKLRQFDTSWIRDNCAKNQSDNQWRNTQGNLTECFHEYIRLKKITYSLDKDFELLDFFKEHELNINYSRLLISIRKKLNNQPIDFYSNYYNFRLKEHEAILSTKSKKRKGFGTLSEWDKELDQFYYINKLKVIIAKGNRNNLIANISIENQQDFISQIPPDYANLPAISMLIDSYKMFAENKSEYYYQLKEISTSKKEISFGLRSYIFSLLLNFTTRQYNSGNDKFKQEYLEVIDIMKNFNMLSQNGEADRRKIKNVATMALRMNKIAWLEDFLKESREKIKGTNMNAVFDYAESLILFHNKKYLKTIKILDRASPIDEALKVSKDILMIKSYFILEEYDLLNKKTDTLRRKINNNQILTKRVKTARKDFIKFIIPVFNNRQFRYELINIKTKMEEYRHFPEKDWIIAQIDQIISKKSC
ncbi:MAG: hypothetical protein ACI94Y_004085 [Maribacter sp.]|jgi:hypothetical protein